jgi:hypothetical protein
MNLAFDKRFGLEMRLGEITQRACVLKTQAPDLQPGLNLSRPQFP